jgi:membrane-associated phospholipid phosphatase
VRWEWIAVAYASYLAVVSLTARRFARARGPALVAAAVTWIAAVFGGGSALETPGLRVVVPIAVLLAGYWLSGRFFTQPMPEVEQWLSRVDEALLDRTGIRRWYERAPAVVTEAFELSYLLVYLVAAAGALALVGSGRVDHLGRFWATVLLAGFVAYGALPWIQTRSPRTLRPDPDTRKVRPIRRLNHFVLNRGSIQANTLPSGHAAVAFAVGLAVADVAPAAGSLLMGFAAIITAATVLGRYHYAVDSILGVLVAAVAWALVRFL